MSTLRTIAKDLDISVSLVSKVLSGRLGTTGASARTVEAIREAARRLNYSRNVAATALATGRQNVVGVFIHRHGEPGSNVSDATVHGVARAATDCGQRLMLRFFETGEEFRIACREMPPNTLDGLVVAGVLHEDLLDTLERMQRRGLAIVTTHERPISPKIAAIFCDQQRVGELATEHLIERGCRRIAHIKRFNDRFIGYQRALRTAGIPYDPALVYEAADFGHASGRAAGQHWLSKGVKFDGVVAQSDHHLTGLYPVLMAASLCVPEDVRLVGVDNSPFCEFYPVPLTSVSQEDCRRGETAVHLLVRRIEGEEIASQQIEPVLVQRASS